MTEGSIHIRPSSDHHLHNGWLTTLNRHHQRHTIWISACGQEVMDAGWFAIGGLD